MQDVLLVAMAIIASVGLTYQYCEIRRKDAEIEALKHLLMAMQGGETSDDDDDSMI